MQNFWSKYILLAAALIIVIKILTNLSLYTDPYDYALYADRYERSQYVLNIKATNIIADDDLYSYAGYYYITGGEVSRVNFENPPLGKYLIGVSILLFKNQRVVYIFYAILFLFLIYKMGLLIFKNPVIAALGVLWASLDPYFTNQMSYPMLDLPMAVFFVIGLYNFISGKQLKDYLIASLFFGLSVATKFFPAFGLILLFFMFYQWVFRRNLFSVFLVSLPLTPLVYCVNYLELFRRVSLTGFLEFQWWMLKWRAANPVVIGNALESIYSGRYRTWWDLAPHYNYYTSDWTPLIPLAVSISLYSVCVFRKNSLFVLTYAVMVLFFIYLNILTEGSLKYLIAIYVFLALFTSGTIYTVLLQLTHRNTLRRTIKQL